MATTEQLRNWYERDFSRSFDPREWYDFDEGVDHGVVQERIMWVYRLIAGAFVVGFFTPDREWVEDQSFKTKDEAAARVHYLMGGQ